MAADTAEFLIVMHFGNAENAFLHDIVFVRMADEDAVSGYKKGKAHLFRQEPGYHVEKPIEGDICRHDSGQDPFVLNESVKGHRVGRHRQVTCALIKIGFAPDSLLELFGNLVPVQMQIIIGFTPQESHFKSTLVPIQVRRKKSGRLVESIRFEGHSGTVDFGIGR